MKRVQDIMERVVIQKTARMAVVINAVQIVLMALIGIAMLLGDSVMISSHYVRAIMAAAALVVMWGAALDIREALAAQRAGRDVDMLRDALEQLEELNVTLRGQRHDFMNHLQVVYSLMELGEYGEAMGYIERTYDDIQSVSGAMKTASPAINALLMAKCSDARSGGIDMMLKITSTYDALPMESWEMCRVLGNLIDNGMDAVEGGREPRMVVELSEDLHSYRFRVFNNGPAVRPEHAELIFQTGFTTKAKGTGMGLYIVRSILREHGGDVTLESGGEGVAFVGVIPKHAATEDTKPTGSAD